MYSNDLINHVVVGEVLIGCNWSYSFNGTCLIFEFEAVFGWADIDGASTV